jgi:hypothetical protein
MVLQRGSSLRTITGGNTCRETDLSIPFWDRYANTPVDESGTNAFYWPNEGKVVGGNVVKFYYRNVPTPDGWWTDTHTAITTIPISALEGATVINQTPTLMPPVYTYNRHPINWGSALLDAGNWTYIYGAGIVDGASNRRLYLARTAPGNLANPATWQFWGGEYNKSWSAPGDQAAAGPVALNLYVENGFSVARYNGWYWLVQHEPSLNGGDIVAHPAANPWEFGPRRVRLYTPPEGPRDAAHRHQFYYEARIQPSFGSSSGVAISYNVNSSEVSIGCRLRTDHDPDIYRPRFINVPVSTFRAGDATIGTASPSTLSAGTPTRDLRGLWGRTGPGVVPTPPAGQPPGPRHSAGLPG